jgi:outer membrane protein
MRFTAGLIFLAFFLLPRPGLSETLDLRKALLLAVQERPFSQAAQYQSEASRYMADEARSGFFPRLTLTENLYWTDEPAGSMFISLNQQKLKLSNNADTYNSPPSRKDFETRLSLKQKIFDPEIYYGFKRARKGADSAALQSSWSRQQAAFEAFRTYLRVQQAQAALGWVEAARKEAVEIHRLARERWETGAGLKADLLRAKVLLIQAEQRVLSAGNDLRIARQALAIAVGRSGGDVSIGPPVEEKLLETKGDFLIDERADLQVLKVGMEEADLAHRQSRAAYLPVVGMDASYAYHDGSAPFGTEAEDWTIRAGLTWEIFDGFQRSSRMHQAVAQQKTLQAQWREARLQAKFHVREAELRLKEAHLNLESVRAAHEAAQEGQRLMRERYEAGLSRLGELLEVQKELDRARFEKVRGESDLLLAQGHLLFQKGIFLKVLLPGEGS